MLQFLATYGSSIIIALIVAFIVFLVIRSMVKEKKSGKGGCGSVLEVLVNYCKVFESEFYRNYIKTILL